MWGIVLARLTHQPRGGVVSMTYLCGMQHLCRRGHRHRVLSWRGHVPRDHGTLFQQVLAAAFSVVTERFAGEPGPSGQQEAVEPVSQVASR